MKELFIPYTEALALKELGFNEKGIGSYKTKTYSVFKEGEFYINPPTDENSINAPLYSQAFKFFRNKYNLILDILPFYDEEQLPLSLTNKQKPKGYFIWDYYDDEFDLENSPNYKIYEEAELECIRKLIEIVKKEQKK